MRRGRTLIFVFLILIIAGVVGYVVYTQYFAKPVVVELPSFTEVYIAGQPIPQGATITAEMLGTIQIVQGQNLDVMFTIDEQPSLVGYVAKFPLEQGVVLTASMIGETSSSVSISGPSWAALIPPGMTAISIPADRFSLSGYAINNGAHVNLNACFLFVDVDPAFQSKLPNKTASLTGTGFGNVTSSDGSSSTGLPILTLGVGGVGTDQGRLELDPSLQQPYYLLPSEPSRPRMVCQMMLQDIVVMKMGNFSLATDATIDTPSVAAAAVVDPAADPNAVPAQAPVLPPDIVTLIVTPQDAITLTYLINAQILPVKNPDGTITAGAPQTRLSMTLRNPNDQARQSTEASTLQFLLSQYNITIPAKLPYALEPSISTLLGTTVTIATP
jgi:pilus assembly protein CpaB